MTGAFQMVKHMSKKKLSKKALLDSASEMIDSLHENGGKPTKIILNIADAKTIFPNAKVGEVCGKIEDLPVFVGVDCPPGKAYAIDESTLTLNPSSDLRKCNCKSGVLERDLLIYGDHFCDGQGSRYEPTEVYINTCKNGHKNYFMRLHDIPVLMNNPVHISGSPMPSQYGIDQVNEMLDRVLANQVTPDLNETILQEAQRITHGARQQDYQLPERNFKQIAEIATAILGKEITPKDAAMVLITVKLSREAFKHKRDNLTDLAGYAWCLSRIEGDEAV